MTRAEIKLLYRLLVLVCIGLAAGLGIAVAKTNPEIDKILPASNLRNLLMLAGPLALLALTGFNLTRGNVRVRSLKSEFLLIGVGYSAFLFVALPFFLTTEITSGRKCWFFGSWCSTERRPEFWWTVPVAVSAGLLLTWLWKREFSKRGLSAQTD